MDVPTFRALRAQRKKALSFWRAKEYWTATKEYQGYLEGVQAAAAPEHAGNGYFRRRSHFVGCACGWGSYGYGNGTGAWNDWAVHVEHEMGLIPQKCPCGQEYIPADGLQACHELVERSSRVS